MSRHYPPATEGEMDRLLLIVPQAEAPMPAAAAVAADATAHDPGDEDPQR